MGAALLAASEFCPLLRVRTIAAHPRLVRTIQGGPHHAWGLLAIALVAGLLTALAGRGGRSSAVMVALLGLGALAVILGADIPDVHAAGLVRGAAPGPIEAQAHAAIGLYLETLGALGLLVAAATAAVIDRGR